jgi:drug/metabolite transporter (DMT)-like permease
MQRRHNRGTLWANGLGSRSHWSRSALALERATPTRVANTMTVNPIAAGLLATQLVGEPITPNLVLGLIAVFAGIWIATSEIKRP